MSNWKKRVQDSLHNLLFHHAPRPIQEALMSCQEVTLEQARTETSALKKLKIFIHVAACSCCSNYQDQQNIMSQQFSKIKDQATNTNDSRELKNLEQKIIEQHAKK